MKILKILALGLATVLLTIISVAVLVIWKPDGLVNEKSLKWVVGKIQSPQLQISWRVGDISLHSESFLDKRIHLKFEDLCLDIKSIEVKGCVEKLDVGARVVYKAGKVKILEVSPLVLNSKEFLVNLLPTPEQPPSKPGMFSEIVSFKTKFSGIDVDLEKLKFVSGETKYLGNIKVKDPAQGKLPWNILGKIEAKSLTDDTQIHADFDFSSNLSLVSKVRFQSGTLKIDGDLDFFKKKKEEYRLNINVVDGKNLSAYSKIKGTFSEPTAKGSLSGNIIIPGSKFELGENKECAYEIGTKGFIKLDCPFSMIPDVTTIKGVNLSSNVDAIKFVAKTELKSRGGLNTEGPWDGNAEILVSTEGDPPVSVQGQIKSDIENLTFNGDTFKKIKAQADVKFNVNRFQDIVRRLMATPYAVPAPLNVLTGKLGCAAKGTLDMADLNIPFQCDTDLHSPQQALVLTSQGAYGDSKLKADVVLNDVQIALPRFGLQGPPPLFPDSRFKKSLAPVKKDPASEFKYEIKINTASGKPVRLLSNLAKKIIPVDINLHMTSADGMMGKISVKEFPAELFRRDARIKYFDLYLSPKGEEKINGLLEVHYTDYTISVIVEGTAKEPLIRFESVPPLSQEDTISVLLFGRKLNEANPYQTGSVTNLRAAATDRAIGLASMYLLASTPVESVGYNSQSSTFTAKVRLAEGTSLNVGANTQGVSEVGINRHLSGPWYIYTYVRDPTSKEDRSTAAFLEWVLRY